MRIACVLLLALPLWAQTPHPTTAAGSSVAGKVVNAATGEPLKKAAVLLMRVEGRGQAQSMMTDEQGQFAFRSLETGRYRLLVNRTGYVRQAYGQRDPYADTGGSPLTLSAGQEVKDILFRLLPAGAISGRVVDEDGEGMMEVQVQALRWTTVRGRRQLMPASGERTNDRGEYRIYNLPPGRYYLAATYEGGYVTGYLVGMAGGVSEAPLDEAYAPVFYPGTSDLAQASALDLRGGDELGGMNMVLAPQRTVTVNGRVLNAITGQPGRNVHVSIMARNGTVRSFISGDHDTTTDDQGYFHVRGVLPGSYIISAEWDVEGHGAGTIITSSREEGRTVVYGGRHYSARQPLEIGGADLESVSLVIAPGVDVAGSVRTEGVLPKLPSETETTTQAGGRSIRISRSNEMRVVLEPTDDLNIGNLVAQIKPDNTFVINNAPDETYRINVAGLPEGAYIKSARFAGQDVLEDGLAIMRGRRGSLDLVISANAGTVSGTITDSDRKPFAGARVVLVPEGSRRKRPSLFRTATADQYGRFNLRSVPPGDYKVFAWDSMEAGAYQDAEFLRPFEDRGQPVRVNESSQSTVEAQVIMTGPRAL